MSNAPSPLPRPGSSLASALALVPPRRRAAAAVWLQWWHEVSSIPYQVSDPAVGETKLRWWQQQVQVLLTHQRAEHPVLKAWMSLPESTRQPRDPALWLDQIEALTTLLHQTRWLDDAALQHHVDMSTGRAFEGAALTLGASDTPAVREAARALGRGVRRAHLLGRLGQDARAGWVHVPIDTLQQHGVRAHELTRPEQSAPTGLASLLAALRDHAVDDIDAGRQAMKALPAPDRQAMRPLLALAMIYRALADQVCAHGDRVLHQRIVLTPLRKAWIAQRVAWGWLR